MSSADVDRLVVIVGAGFSGIGVARALDRANITDYEIVEQGDGFGGTWYWNRYPGLAVDIPSFSYQFSYAKRTNWSRVYASGDELRDYAEDCARRFALHGRTRFGTKITSATFDEDHHAWRLETGGGDVITARHVIDATGVLTQPKLPEIQDVETFGGVTMHTARWDHTQDLTGKRVAVIGTGASAVQVIPAIAKTVGHLTVFQRTPIWCLPKLDGPLPRWVRWFMERVPGGAAAMRLLSQSFVELIFPLAAHYHRTLRLATVFESSARKYVRDQVHDPELCDKLTPRYALGCKRPGFHNEYLATFNRPNVVLETQPIARISAEGIVTSDGTLHEADVVIHATGFKVFDPGNFPKYPVRGRAGIDLARWWDENRYQAYEGVSVPGFPNYFTMFGPYGYNGSSYFNLVETQSRHIVRALRHAQSNHATLIEVSDEANARYFAEMLRRRRGQVFWRGGCALANSYYFDPHGDVPLRPSPTIETMWRARHFPLGDYRLERLVVGQTAEAVAA